METKLSAAFPEDNFKLSPVQDIISSTNDMHQALPAQLLTVSQVTQNLFLTCAASVTPQMIKNYHITCVINAAAELTLYPIDDVHYFKVPVFDHSSANIAPYLDPIADIIYKNTRDGKRTVLFCVAGISRSSTLCLSYLMKYYGASLLDAFKYLRTRRPKIRPNIGFFQQLMQYEASLFHSNSVYMVYNEMLHMNIPSVYDEDYKMTASGAKSKRKG